jgi:hypothetical protein
MVKNYGTMIIITNLMITKMIKKFETYNKLDPYGEENWNETEKSEVKYITIHAIDKDSSATMSRNLVFTMNQDKIEEQINDFFDEIPFPRYYYEVECQDILNNNEIEYLKGLGLDVY